MEHLQPHFQGQGSLNLEPDDLRSDDLQNDGCHNWMTASKSRIHPHHVLFILMSSSDVTKKPETIPVDSVANTINGGCKNAARCNENYEPCGKAISRPQKSFPPNTNTRPARRLAA